MNEFYNKMKYFEETDKIASEIYYHYTSLAALCNIVESKTFRLTSLLSSNDKKEMCYKPEVFLEDFSGMYEKEKNEDTKKCFQLIKESIDLNRESFIKECKAKIHPYALCLSKKKDNLTHWDRYAENCTGVCIGFNASSLRVLMQRMAITAFGIGVYDLGSVLYSAEQKNRYIGNALIDIINALCKQEGIDYNQIIEIIKKNGYIYAASAYMQTAKFVKNDSFVDEDEVRIYHDSNSIKGTLRLIELMKPGIEYELFKNLKIHFNEFVDILQLKDEHFYVASNGIRSYRELCLESVWGSGVIPEIILGPTCIQNKKELRQFLNANGLSGTKISVSEVPIR